MKFPDPTLFTPIYVKSRKDMPWPDDEKAFYLLTSSGLFLCRNHPFFRSCAPVRNWPSELAKHESSLELRYPKLSQRLFERIVGFFDRIGQLHGSEAAVLLAWDSVLNRVRLIVPEQTATVSKSSWTGRTYAIGLHYENPTDLPPHVTVFGDAHSHVDDPAYASGTDKHDEAHRPGLHLVVGRISREPPDIHIEAVVDGTRFEVEPEQVIEGYKKRRTRLPQAWIDRVKVEPYASFGKTSSSSSSYGSSWGSSGKGYYGSGYSGSSYYGSSSWSRSDTDKRSGSDTGKSGNGDAEAKGG